MADANDLPGITLTKEQQAIIETCQPPIASSGKGQLIRVTAAAGTGKTTSLLSLALRAANLGHRRITYLTFTKAAAQDGTQRLSKALENAGLLGKVIVDARTLHSCAFHQITKHQSTDASTATQQPGTINQIWSEKKMKKWIALTLNNEIEEFLSPCQSKIDSWQNLSNVHRASIYRQARDRVEFFIFKTFRQFCTRSINLREFQDASCYDRNYFPAKQFHTTKSKVAEKLGFDPRVYGSNKIRWYADQACKLYDFIEKDDIRTFDLIMKRAQLLSLEIPGTILLIDESQDMDGCQVNWVAEKQVQFAKQVYVVGDAAQTIYGFRGAKSKYLMDLSIDHELMLTECWRFGPKIANIANLVLFAKENSDQTEKHQSAANGRNQKLKWKNWIPYRVKSGKDIPAHVTETCFMSDWQNYRAKSEKVTLIARQNTTLFQAALLIFGFTAIKDDDKSITNESSPQVDKNTQVKQEAQVNNTKTQIKREDQEPREASNSDDDYDYIDDCTSGTSANPPRNNDIDESSSMPANLLFPKMHINGYGETSGRKAWLSTFKLIDAVYKLFELSQNGELDPSGENDAAMTIPPSQFPEFAGRQVSWSSFCKDVVQGEMNRYSIPISVVKTYKEQTMAAVKRFKEEVIDTNYSVDESDLILSTCHAAKGMEWDHVQVLDDFIDLANYDCYKSNQRLGFRPANKRQKVSSKPWKFGFDSWGDDLNLAYVACTRAKRTLSISSFLMKVIRDFDHILAWKAAGLTSAELPLIEGLAHRRAGVTPQELEDIYSSLVVKFRKEVGVSDECRLLEYLLPSNEAESMDGAEVKTDNTPETVAAQVIPVQSAEWSDQNQCKDTSLLPRSLQLPCQPNACVCLLRDACVCLI